ncbi:MAG: potassium transporter TrkG [Candidatus Brocadiia bacterium]
MIWMVRWPSPARLLVFTFVFLVLAGTWLLLRPVCTGGQGINLIDALFTSTSAVCVTGLTVVDVGTRFTFVGQLALLLLIQLGGLGILTLSNWMWVSLRKKASPLDRFMVSETIGALKAIEPQQILRRVIMFTVVCEGIGTVILTIRFLFDMGFREAVWCGLFHSVSAFCNAGFSLFPDNLVRYRGDFIVNAVIMALIIAGGIGFLVVADVWEGMSKFRLRNVWAKLSYQSRVVLLTTLILIVGGALFFLILEWNNVLSGLPWYQWPIVCLFQSVTARTAGYNTVDMASLTNTTLLGMIILMYIGASPGSTGGGIKTTTAAVIWASVMSRIRGRKDAELMRRRISIETMSRAAALAAVYVAIVVVAVIALQTSEFGSTPHKDIASGLGKGQFLDHLFEVTSAIGTVGLSTGITAAMSDLGRLILVLVMFVGRVGPLIIAASLVARRRPVAYSLPEEKVMIG